MKKVILAVAVAVLVSSLSFGQWQESFYVDEFGEKTEDSFMYIISNDGTFSNSATQNSKLKCQFMLNDDSLSIKVYEYGRSLATGSEGTFEKVKIKTPSDEIVEIKKVFFSKGGFLYFSKKIRMFKIRIILFNCE